MDKPIIEVKNLSKRYTLGATGGTTTVADSLENWWLKLRAGRTNGKDATPPEVQAERRLEKESRTFWALKDISFTVAPGEVIGLIGQNGAGKSTLLKILSRITEPSSGEAILRGRITSLLEVGTGFHHDLSGRENIYLNGAMLGMRTREIDRKFDEIVEFAEVADFLDTPVKRYSSGMFVRLAFAVAAHLEPEILLVDEVLAVGDSAFQKKCMGKMDAVAKQGRTVLLVSHNMASILSLCERVILLNGGRILDSGPAEEVVTRYLQSSISNEITNLSERRDRDGDGEARLVSVKIESEESSKLIRSTSSVTLTLSYKSARPLKHPRFLATIYDYSNTGIYMFDSDATGGLPEMMPAEGVVTCTTGPINLTPGRCYVNLSLFRGLAMADHVEFSAYFDVEAEDVYGTGKLPPRELALCILPHQWAMQPEDVVVSR